ncbi:hypothetical protein SeMB42_g01801 [Synchytrium endobioticum]|uniref:HAMP domain-containing protein n=1 Tax=Synchytrium endobioticum TaxID=286115 RepID=A0A507DJU3_9FUNG|nr:hypothetical protein SeLEV6574_g02917 [Synchytrium endobioticum]TPX51893.1 hypothetical protein SeMB42_g01801 [Synchytrium endobioticum]
MTAAATATAETGVTEASTPSSSARPKGFQLRIPLWVVLLTWVLLFAGGLSLTIGLIQATAGAASLDSMSTQLRVTAMRGVTVAINDSLNNMEDVLMAISETSELLSFINSDPNIGTAGTTTLSLFSSPGPQLMGRFKSACGPLLVCRVAGVMIGDNALLSYTDGTPGLATVQDASTLAAGNYSNRYVVTLDTNATAILDSSTLFSRNGVARANNSVSLATYGLFNYPTSIFWANSVTASSNLDTNGNIIDYDQHIFLLRAGYWNQPYGTSDGNHFTHVVRVSMSIRNFELYMTGLNSTKNGIVFVMDPQGSMISASTPNISAVNYGSTRWTACFNPNALVAAACSFLNTTFNNNMSAIPADGVDVTFSSGSTGPVLLNAKWITRTNLQWLMISAIPRSDVFAVVDAGNIYVSVSAAVISVVGTVLSLALAIAVTRPLRVLQRAMEQAKSFQFQEIRENQYLKKRSMLAELASMQDTFNVMLKKFAEGIQANKSLQPYKTPSANQYLTDRKASGQYQNNGTLPHLATGSQHRSGSLDKIMSQEQRGRSTYLSVTNGNAV